MIRQRRRDTAPEIEVRRALHRRGYRYRLHAQIVPGTRRAVDIVFLREHVAVDVRGCFWHGCRIHGTRPKSHGQWWQQKLEANRLRDADTEDRLRVAGWEVVTVWEHEDVDPAVNRIAAAVDARRKPRSAGQSPL